MNNEYDRRGANHTRMNEEYDERGAHHINPIGAEPRLDYRFNWELNFSWGVWKDVEKAPHLPRTWHSAHVHLGNNKKNQLAQWQREAQRQ